MCRLRTILSSVLQGSHRKIIDSLVFGRQKSHELMNDDAVTVYDACLVAPRARGSMVSILDPRPSDDICQIKYS